ncbi:MAG: type II secretion system ATPase GspE [Archangium sp.]|nr:type II secretion system ATPase GspE [Archangium sp.]
MSVVGDILESTLTERTHVVTHGPAYLFGRPLGEILVANFGLPREKLDEALAAQLEKGGRLGEVLIGLKSVTDEQVTRALAAQLDLEFVDVIGFDDVDPELVKKVPINFAKQAKFIPLKREGEFIAIAVADPLDTAVVDHARTMLDGEVLAKVARGTTIIDAINSVYDRSLNEAEQVVGEMEAQDLDAAEQVLESEQDLLDTGDEAPIIRLVNSLLFRAAKERASDIHIEPMERELAVRFRIDGVLQNVIKPPKRYQNSILSRVKIMAQLNIAEKRLPQDGRIKIKLAGRDIDIRVSTIPTVHGESIVMRLLDKSATLLDLAEIGMNSTILAQLDELIRRSHGIVLVTGPTGSGKTTTLYGALTRINTPEVKILTVEDPVEYQLKGINQMPLNPKIGLTFASGLRAFLRQDPDIIMVGEIRDKETAQIAIEASLTGHLVFSTVHTNDSAGAVTRLVEMGVEPFLVSSSLMAVMAQRLVRRVCKECREEYLPSDEEVAKLGMSMDRFRAFGGGKVYRASARGCAACSRVGYRGRTGIYELLVLDDDIRQLVLKNVDSGTVKKKAMEKGMLALLDDGALKVARGETTIAEILSVTQEDL